MKAKEFARGLSPALMGAFDKDLPLRGVLDACVLAGCDIRLREDEVHAYHDGNRIAKLCLCRSEPRLVVNRKYLVDGIRHGKGVGDYVRFPVDAAFVASWRGAVSDVIKEAKRARRNPEGEWEQKLIRANGASKPVQILDRQVQLPGLRGKLDLLGVLHREAGGIELAAIELKHRLNNDIQVVALQLARYVNMLQENGRGLKSDIAVAYRTVAKQMRDLGRDAPAASDIASGMPVTGLAVLAEYNDRSQLLDRARRTTSEEEMPHLYYTCLRKTSELPTAERWLPLTMDDR